jgi:YfiH family protein
MVTSPTVLVEREDAGVPWYAFAGLDDGTRLLTAVSTRAGGVSQGEFGTLNVSASVGDDPERWRANRARLYRALDVRPERVAYVRQVHGNCVVEATDLDYLASSSKQGVAADAQMTNEPGVCLFLTFADCVPILLYASRQEAIGVAHAGWRGTLAGVASVLARAMVVRYGCQLGELRAAIGPSIGPCCYEVGAEVARPFVERRIGAVANGHDRGRSQRWRVDLADANRRQLVELGLDEANVECCRVCTACNVDRFFSHRAQHGKAGRFAVLAMLR